jgi:short-subunit dehydrogenase
MKARHASWITGAASGIGRAFAKELVARGDDVVLIDIQEKALEETANALRAEATARVVTRVVDVSSEQAVAQMVESLSSEIDRLDLLINCAAILGPGRFEAQSLRAFATVVAVDLMGTVHMVHACLPRLREARGRIINMASTASLHGWPELAAYSAVKGAVENFSESIRAELARDGVSITAVFPLLVDTPMLQRSQLPPILRGRRISAEFVARESLRAASERRPRLYLPWTVRLVALAHAIAPGALDWWGARKVGRARGSVAAPRIVSSTRVESPTSTSIPPG